uniref:Protein XNDC1N isoform X2 n=1 Tax=Pogona vitticeps TaxID=103695 RepID=A0ABM5FVM8_9SAUR
MSIDVGRSSWPIDQRYPTLLPATSLMTPADAKLEKNRSGVRMFKEGDFLAPALGEKWDRVRLFCSQPFNKQVQFGLAFIQIRTPADAEGGKADPRSSPSEAPPEQTRSPWLSNAAICRTFFPEVPSSSQEETALKSRLQQLDPSSRPGGRSPACMSRPARMVLKAASARKRTFPAVVSSSPPAAECKGEGQARVTHDPQASRSKQKLGKGRDRMKTSRRRGSCSNVRRSVAVSSVRSRSHSPGTQGWKRKRGSMEEEEKGEEEGRPERGSEALGSCPICAGCFPTSLLAAHASGCGEEGGEADASSSPSSWWEEPAEAWIDCPICQFRFPASEVESHASSCGEQAGPSGSGSSWLWVE